jgi:Cu2+-exporting ATPase
LPTTWKARSKKPEAKTLIMNLQQQGLRVWCLSGDRAERVTRLADSLGIAEAQQRSGCSPEDKREFVQTLQQQGAQVLMVGDGLNDAPVLAQANVSLAVQSAAPLARQKADAYLIRPGLFGVQHAVATASEARRVLKQNLGWALGYNIVAVPFAALGMISPLLASVGMALSSLVVVLNSARITRS